MRPRLLITGASGFLGWNVLKAANKHWHTIGLAYKHTEHLPADEVVTLDLTDISALKQLIEYLKPDAIIHLAAISDANYCEQHPQASSKLNVDASVALANIAASKSIPFIFTSTDLAFDGTKGYYTEEEAPNPLSAYGNQKVTAETGILQVNPSACICRMPLMFGNPSAHGKSFIQPFLQNLRAGTPINLFTDEYRTAVDGASAAKGLLHAVEQGWTGTWHLGGPQRLSRFEFGLMLAEVFSISNPNINPIRQQDLQMAAPRPADVSLNSSKAFKAGYQPVYNKEALLSLKHLL